MKLSDMQLFRGLEEDDISSLLSCLNSVKRNYKKGEVILSEGSIIENIGIVRSGMAMISCNDIWGNTSILGSVAPGSVFAEVYACIPGQPMLVIFPRQIMEGVLDSYEKEKDTVVSL